LQSTNISRPKVFSSVRPVILKSSTTAEANKATNSTVVIANKWLIGCRGKYKLDPRKIVKSKSYRALESGRMPEENSLPEIARYATKEVFKKLLQGSFATKAPCQMCLRDMRRFERISENIRNYYLSYIII
jgi:hypothetical protein